MQSQLVLTFLGAMIASAAHAQAPGDIARGNMHFDVKAMDSNGDGMISKTELMRYGESMWDRMARAANVSIPVNDAAAQFARGDLKFDAKAVDANGDGTITKEEFTKYGEAKFDSMKKDPHGSISVADIARDFGRGNMRPTD